MKEGRKGSCDGRKTVAMEGMKEGSCDGRKGSHKGRKEGRQSRRKEVSLPSMAGPACPRSPRPLGTCGGCPRGSPGTCLGSPRWPGTCLGSPRWPQMRTSASAPAPTAPAPTSVAASGRGRQGAALARSPPHAPAGACQALRDRGAGCEVVVESQGRGRGRAGVLVLAMGGHWRARRETTPFKSGAKRGVSDSPFASNSVRRIFEQSIVVVFFELKNVDL